jgi:ribulose-5-phosphate 4-epimerase/fuculose-1-phosphate aldolase
MSAALQLAKTEMSDLEWQTRCDLASLYHVINHLGWTDLINTHMSARIPGEPNTFLINNYGEMFDEVTASSLVKMDMDGNVLSPGGKFNNAGPDSMCVLHTHTRAGAGVSLIDKGLRPISQDSLAVYDDVAYHAYGVPATAEECEALGRTCAGGAGCIILLNHGLLTLGHTIHGTFMRLYTLERACELELLARQMDVEPIMISDYVIGKAAERGRKRRAMDSYGLPEFGGLVRTVDRKGADYRR